jgi:TM2 domain-containing membrane protein YozV
LAKSLTLTILLAVVIAGVGHIYLGYKKRGIIILIARVAIWLGIFLFVPFPVSLILGVVLGGGFWIWQLIDAVRLFNKMKSGIDGQINIKKT